MAGVRQALAGRIGGGGDALPVGSALGGEQAFRVSQHRLRGAKLIRDAGLLAGATVELGLGPRSGAAAGGQFIMGRPSATSASLALAEGAGARSSRVARARTRGRDLLAHNRPPRPPPRPRGGPPGQPPAPAATAPRPRIQPGLPDRRWSVPLQAPVDWPRACTRGDLARSAARQRRGAAVRGPRPDAWPLPRRSRRLEGPSAQMAAAASAVVSFATASANWLPRLVLSRPSQLEISRGGGSAASAASAAFALRPASSARSRRPSNRSLASSLRTRARS